MIQLPPGFDYNLLFNDFISFVVPFVPIALLFVAFRVIKKASHVL